MTLHYIIQHLLVVLLFSSSVLFYTGEAQVLNCRNNETKFEKLIGLRPNVLQKNTLLYSSRNNTPVTLECLSRCANSDGCTSFLLYYNTSECYSYVNISMTTQNYDYDSRPDTNVVWFRKTCLNVPDSCKTKAWTTEILAGATLIGYNTKRIANRLTRQRCIQSCMDERSFQCKSIKFTVISDSEEMISADPVGICVLSAVDRHLTPNGFRVSRYEDEYIENQCVNTTFSTDFCAYEEYDNTTLEHIDLTFPNTKPEQCQDMCDTSFTFNCRGYSLVPSTVRTTTRPPSTLPQYTCLLHSEDSKLIGPKLLIPTQGAKYFERARCLNVSVSCSTDSMTFKYQPEQPFTGRIYTSGYSDKPPCYADGRYNATVILNIPFNHSVCGSTEALSVDPNHRIMKTVLVVIQYNALIQTQADRLITVGCVYDGNSTSQNDEEITVDTSVNFTSSYPNRGSTVVNSSSVLPNVTMRIVDYNSQKPTSDTEIGQELQMIIEITPGDGPYDIWAGNLIATSGNNTIQLLDANGCPTYLNIFLPFTKIQTNSSKKLVSTFQAFKFPSTQLVRFSVIIHFCTLTCPSMECVNQETENRAKRETQSEAKEQLTNDSMGATIYKLNDKRTANNNTDDLVEEMPLDILLIVRGVNIVSDQLVVGENRILVAGYDYVTNEVCVDYSLFIGLLVTWVLLQVIIVVCCFLLIRKYKKYFHIAYTRQLDDMHQNFGFGSRDLNRRVHWADQ